MSDPASQPADDLMTEDELAAIEKLTAEQFAALPEATKEKARRTADKFQQERMTFSDLDGMVIGGKSVDEYLAPDKDTTDAAQEGQEGSRQ